MSKGFFIGDPHGRADDIQDLDGLAKVVVAAVELEQPDWCVIAGDLHDGFALKHVSVERWYQRFFALLRAAAPKMRIYLLVGNHDRPGDSSQEAHALQSYAGPGIVVVDQPTLLEECGYTMLLPFYFLGPDFEAACQSEVVSKATTIFCHQSFIGGKYESGQPIEARHDRSAADPGKLPQRCFISGHIHTPQTMPKVWYPGAPRWRNNVSDANVDRFVYAIDTEKGLPKAVRPYSTGDICRRMWHAVVTPEGVSIPVEHAKHGDLWVVDLKGPAAFIEEAKKSWSLPGMRLRLYQTDRPGPKLSEADGVPAAWKKWEGSFQPKHGTSIEVLAQMARERLAL